MHIGEPSTYPKQGGAANRMGGSEESSTFAPVLGAELCRHRVFRHGPVPTGIGTRLFEPHGYIQTKAVAARLY